MFEVMLRTCLCDLVQCSVQISGRSSTPIFLLSCHPLPSVPSFLLLLFVPLISAFLYFSSSSSSSSVFFFNYVRAQSQTRRAFLHKQPSLSLRFSACLFWVLFWDDISAGKPNGPERVLSLRGSSRRGVKIGKSFLGNGIKNWRTPPQGPLL